MDMPTLIVTQTSLLPGYGMYKIFSQNFQKEVPM